jgi:hypothetical protein
MWLPSPPAGTSVAGGLDGSDSDDWTAIKLETRAGLLFTPRWGADRLPTIWRPSDHGGKIPRGQVHAAWSEIVETYDLRRAYCDPGFHDETSWESEIEEWAQEWPLEDGKPDRFVQFPTNVEKRMFAAIRRFEGDLPRAITHDGCPLTIAHMRNARKVYGRGRTYRLGKPSHHQKIDVAVTSVLAHEAAADERAAGWPEAVDTTVFCFT